MITGRSGEREELLRKIFGKDAAGPPEKPRYINTRPLFQLRDIWPDVVDRLKTLLTEAGELQLAATVEDLQVYDRCDCGADFCATVYTRPRPSGSYGPTHRNLVFWNPDTIDLDTGISVGDAGVYPIAPHTTILDVVDEQIACIEILDDDGSRRRLLVALPDVEI